MLTHTHRAFRYGAIAALSLASVFASSAVAMASPIAQVGVKADFFVQGTVTILSPSTGTPTSLTIQPRNPSAPTENIVLSSSTVFHQSGAVVSASALSIGEPVKISLTGSPATAVLVEIQSPEPIYIDGTVTALTPSTGTPTSVTIQPRDAKRPTVNVALGASTLYYLGGKSTLLTSLVVGSQVVLEATGNPATATVVEIVMPKPIEIDGVVTALSPASGTPTSVTIMPPDHHAVAVSVALGSSTVYQQRGAFVTVASLLVGSHVKVLASGNPETATAVRIAVPKPVYVSGVVTALSPSPGTPTSVTIQPNGYFKSPLTVALGASTVYYQFRVATTVAVLLVGSHVELSATGNPLTATVVHVAAPVPQYKVGGVTAVSSSSLTIQPQATGSVPMTFALTSTTKYFSGRDASSINAVNVGDIVSVSDYASAATTAVSVTVRNTAIIGRVTGVVGNVISVRGFYGGALTANVTATTVYTLSGKASSLSAILVGDLIVAQGPAMAGVTNSVTASNVWIGTKDNSIYHYAWLQHQFWGKRHHR